MMIKTTIQFELRSGSGHTSIILSRVLFLFAIRHINKWFLISDLWSPLFLLGFILVDFFFSFRGCLYDLYNLLMQPDLFHVTLFSLFPAGTPSYYDFRFEKSVYKILHKHYNGHEAKTACSALGMNATLAMLDSQQEEVSVTLCSFITWTTIQDETIHVDISWPDIEMSRVN